MEDHERGSSVDAEPPQHPFPPKPTTWLSTRILDDLEAKHTDLIFLFLCFITALCDSSAYSVWSCYLGLQTGNTITLGLGASGQPKSKPFGWLKSLVSISSFMAGSFAFANGMRLLGPRRAVTLSLSFLVQASLLTSVYFDIAPDPHLFTSVTKNAKRNRRVCDAVLYVVGAISGGWLSQRWWDAVGLVDCGRAEAMLSGYMAVLDERARLKDSSLGYDALPPTRGHLDWKSIKIV